MDTYSYFAEILDPLIYFADNFPYFKILSCFILFLLLYKLHRFIIKCIYFSGSGNDKTNYDGNVTDNNLKSDYDYFFNNDRFN